MAELYDKSGNPIEEIYDEEGNQIDETLTSEEVDQRIQEAKDEAMSEYKSDLDSIKEELEEKKIELKFAEEALDKNPDIVFGQYFFQPVGYCRAAFITQFVSQKKWQIFLVC